VNAAASAALRARNLRKFAAIGPVWPLFFNPGHGSSLASLNAWLSHTTFEDHALIEGVTAAVMGSAVVRNRAGE
jgi:hypothetical protein